MNGLDDLVERILRLSARELAELNRRLHGRGSGGLGGARVPVRPRPPGLPPADAEDRSVKGRTL